MDASTSRSRWEVENDVQQVEADALLLYDRTEQEEIRSQKPWKNDPNYFKKCAHEARARLQGSRRTRSHQTHGAVCSVKVSALALLKMVMHARSGGDLEVRQTPLVSVSLALLPACACT